MKLKLKVKDNGRWRIPTLEELKGKSKFYYIADTFDPVVAVLVGDDDKIQVVISNNDEMLDYYRDEGVRVVHSEAVGKLHDIMEILFSVDEEYLEVVSAIFQEAGYVSVESLKGETLPLLSK